MSLKTVLTLKERRVLISVASCNHVSVLLANMFSQSEVTDYLRSSIDGWQEIGIM